VTSLSAHLIRWHEQNGRHDLPWQNTRDPYRVWLSEIMLQQTQVSTVIPYYARFLAKFPQLADLAAAPVADVMALWSGLGYYARARNLHAAARRVMAEHAGAFPQQAEAIAQLPGIGRSTANAIAVFCFDAREAILDGNVKRVLCRALGIEGFPGSSRVEKELWRQAEALLPVAGVATYIQAQMDLGATICTRGKPRCTACPLQDICIARATDRIAALPQARPRRALPERHVTLLILRAGDDVLLELRPPVGIWGGLLSLPELPDHPDGSARLTDGFIRTRFAGRLLSQSPAPAIEHTFSHFRLHIAPLICEIERLPVANEPQLRWLSPDELINAPLPAPIRTLLGAGVLVR